MSNLEFENIQDPSASLQEFLWSQLQEFSNSKLNNPDLQKTASISIVAKENGEIVGGLLAIIYFQGMNLQCLWVHEKYRRKKIGMLFLEKAEEEARKFNCSVIYGHTFGFQAPGFYLKAGYQVFGIIEDFPKGFNCHFLKKSLDT
ncbi:MAG: GNAT family N-acetyltransferase [Leptospira sp.]|nr:GNAT family N-acetyltransferase [Leptospira sp.]